MTSFVAEFVGKKFPEGFPRRLSFVAPTEDRAREWVSKQLAKWGLPADLTYNLSEKEPKK